MQHNLKVNLNKINIDMEKKEENEEVTLGKLEIFC